MLLLLYYIVVYIPLYLQGAVALPQGIGSTETSSVASATPTGTSDAENHGTCDFNTMDDFFGYVNKHGLNITTEVQKCQNLCLLTYGVGNPDLSGIGVSSQAQGFSVFLAIIVADRLCLLI